VLRLRVSAILGEEPPSDPFAVEGTDRVAPDWSIASAASSNNTSPGNVSFFRCNGSSCPATSPRSRPPAMPDSAIRIASIRSSGVGLRARVIAATVTPTLRDSERLFCAGSRFSQGRVTVLRGDRSYLRQ
jgi:hypothetical protein